MKVRAVIIVCIRLVLIVHQNSETMGVSHQNKSSSRETLQHGRLHPARALVKADIPFVVWGADVLNFAPSVRLFGFHVLVPDERVDAAVKVLLDHLPCRIMDAPPEAWTEWKMIDISRPPCFPNSPWLEMTSRTSMDEPATIVVHPQSWFAFDVRDLTCSGTLSPPPCAEDANIRVPTLPALLDSLVTTILDPPLGYRHCRFTDKMNCWIAYLFENMPELRMRRGAQKRRVEPRHKAVVDAMKEVGSIYPFRGFCANFLLKENRSYFMVFMRGEMPDWSPEVYERREVLRKMGSVRMVTLLRASISSRCRRDQEASRPLPENRPRIQPSLKVSLPILSVDRFDKLSQPGSTSASRQGQRCL
jgi:hypothetical protein